MLSLPPTVRIWLSAQPADLRKSLYSFTGTCKHHDIDPFAYLTDILGRLPTQSGERLGELLPDVGFEAHPRARRRKIA
jgi:hypothetical protein